MGSPETAVATDIRWVLWKHVSLEAGRRHKHGAECRVAGDLGCSCSTWPGHSLGMQILRCESSHSYQTFSVIASVPTSQAQPPVLNKPIKGTTSVVKKRRKWSCIQCSMLGRVTKKSSNFPKSILGGRDMKVGFQHKARDMHD